jgi:hypothetical protein
VFIPNSFGRQLTSTSAKHYQLGRIPPSDVHGFNIARDIFFLARAICVEAKHFGLVSVLAVQVTILLR